MTDLAVREEQNNDIAIPDAPTSALLLWAVEAQQAARIAVSLAKTSFVPATLRGKPEDITAAILAGQELGLRPMASLRSMDIIQGTPALRAHAMRGLAQSHGHKIWRDSYSETRVVMKGQRREADGTYGPVQESEWTIERARQMGLADKAEWKKQPGTMLTARATGEVCRLVASDVLHAMPYAVEELEYQPPVDSGVASERVTREEILALAGPSDDEQLASAEAEQLPAEPEGGWPEPAKPGSGGRRGSKSTQDGG